jgi:Tol biopolymer transport system component
VIAFQFVGRDTTEAPVAARGPARDMEIHRLTATGKAREATISADGRYVAYVIDEDGSPGLWITQVTTGSKVPIVPASETALWDPVFSPDGDHVYYCASEPQAPHANLFKIPTLGGSPRKILEDVRGRVSFSPDGTQFVFLRSDEDKSELVVADLDGGNPRVIATKSTPEQFDDPAWSPDGSLIATSLSAFTDEGPTSTVVGISLEDGAEQRLTESSWIFGVGEISWLPDGSGLIVNANEVNKTELWEIAYPSGRTRRVINDLNSYHGVGLTANGETLVTQLNQTTYNVFLLSMEDGSEPERVTSGSDADDGSQLSWTPDGRIVYDSTVRGKWEIWSVNADGSNPQPLVTSEEQNGGSTVTPDGKYVLFNSNRAKTVNIFRADLDGGNVVQLTHGELDVNPAVTPDSRWVIYVQPTTGTLHKVSIDGGESTLLRDKRGNGAIVSPDGKRMVVWTFHEDRDRWLWDIVSIDNGETLQTLEREGIKNIRWAPDGKALTYTFDEVDACNVYRLPLDGGEPQKLTDFDRDHIREFQWSPDGKTLAISRGDTVQDIVLLKNFR